MGTLSVTAAALLLLAPAAPATSPPHHPALERWRPLVARASIRFGIPEGWIMRVMQAESGGRTTLAGRPVVSRAGAMGLMQLMPATWAAMRARLGLGSDPHDPEDNILAGTAYLRLMYDRFGYPGLFGAYNAGPRRYAVSLATGRPLPAETRSYLVAVAGPVPRQPPLRAAGPAPGLFVILKTGRQAPSPGQTRARRDPLFAVLPDR